MRKSFFFTFICCTFCFANLTQAAFPPQYYPSQGHPRLWLTPERLAAFTTAQQQNTPHWIAFKELCDSLIDADPSNDPWNLADSPQLYTAPLALMYRLTNNTSYAARAMVLMDLAPLDFSNYAEPDHESYQYLGLTYDWLYDYAGMTEPKKTAYRIKMKTVSDTFWNDHNVDASGTDSDKNLLTGTVHLMLGAAMYGETADAITLLDRGWHGWETGYYLTSGTSNRDLIKSALGGVYFTGIDYFNSTDARGIASHWLTLKTACDYDINTIEPALKPFWTNIIRSIIHLTEPPRQQIYHYGSWQDPNTLTTQSWMRRALSMAAYFADQAGYTNEAAIARGYAQGVDIGYHNATFEEFFFETPGATVTSPYNGSMPLVRFADEPDFLLFRDNWSTSANWGLFIGNGTIPFDHQAPDQGHFSIWRGNDYLTKGARNYESMANGDFFNTLSIENSCSVNEVPCSGTALFNSEKRASIPRHREQSASPLFAYGMLEADGQWNDNQSEYQPVSNVQTYRRHFFWAGEYVVVFDRLRNKVPLWSKYRLRGLTEPQITGITVSQLSPNGQHKLLQRTLEPAGVTITKVSESIEWSHLEDWVVNASERKWQSVINLPASTRVNILNVIQTGPSYMAAFDTMQHLSSPTNSGVRIGGWVLSFSPEENLRPSVEYTVQNSAANMWHLIADVQMGIYDVFLNGQKTTTIEVKNGDNTALFQTQGTIPLMTIQLAKARSGSSSISAWLNLLLKK